MAPQIFPALVTLWLQLQGSLATRPLEEKDDIDAALSHQTAGVHSDLTKNFEQVDDAITKVKKLIDTAKHQMKEAEDATNRFVVDNREDFKTWAKKVEDENTAALKTLATEHEAFKKEDRVKPEAALNRARAVQGKSAEEDDVIVKETTGGEAKSTGQSREDTSNGEGDSGVKADRSAAEGGRSPPAPTAAPPTDSPASSSPAPPDSAEEFSSNGIEAEVGECVFIDGFGPAKIVQDCRKEKCNRQTKKKAYRIEYPDGTSYHVESAQVTRVLTDEEIDDRSTCTEKLVGKPFEPAGAEVHADSSPASQPEIQCDPLTTCCHAKCCLCDQSADHPKIPVVWSCSGSCSVCGRLFQTSIQESNMFEVQTEGYRSGEMTHQQMNDLAAMGQFKGHDACKQEHPER